MVCVFVEVMVMIEWPDDEEEFGTKRVKCALEQW